MRGSSAGVKNGLVPKEICKPATGKRCVLLLSLMSDIFCTALAALQTALSSGKLQIWLH